MTDLNLETDKIFFSNDQLDKDSAFKIANQTLDKMDDGEIFFEYNSSESLRLQEGIVKASSFSSDQGFGLRGVIGETCGFAHGSNITNGSLIDAASKITGIHNYATSFKYKLADQSNKQAPKLYTSLNPILGYDFATKKKLLDDINEYLYAKSNLITNVSASLNASWQAVKIIKSNFFDKSDIRPSIILAIHVIVEKNGRKESGYSSTGGRISLDIWLEDKTVWQKVADEALRLALMNLEAQDCPAGEFTVVLSNGLSGVLLHEAVGHGLEGDFNRKNLSTFSNRIGQKVANSNVTVVDQGNIDNLRGSISIDDEGTNSQRNVLIENGILVGYMQDRLNARLMKSKATGNGRRQSYAYLPMPRMTNTFMENGLNTKHEMIKSVNRGIYVVTLGGGQVNITNGNFVFECTEAYMIENGKASYPLKGVTLIGSGPDIMTKITMVGNDLTLDEGTGHCGKNGQLVPVGVGQPSIKISSITVGGSALS